MSPPTLEEIYVQGLFMVLTEGPVQSVELIEGRPLPDLLALAGEDRELRRRVEGALTEEHPDARGVFQILTGLPRLRWGFLMNRGSTQILNTRVGLPSWYEVTLEKIRQPEGGLRGLRVTVQALDPETAAARETRGGSGFLLRALLIVLSFVGFQLLTARLPSWVPFVLVAVLWAFILGGERWRERQRAAQEDEVRSGILALRDDLYDAPDGEGLPDRIAGVLVEAGQEVTSKFLAAYADGSVKGLYTDGEMVTIDPDRVDRLLRPVFEPAFAAATALVAAAEPFVGDFAADEGRPLPGRGRVRLVLLTPGGVRAVEESEAALESRTSRFWPIHQAARELEAAIGRAREDRARLLAELRDSA